MLYDYFSYRPGVGDVVALRSAAWFNCSMTQRVKKLEEGEILVVIDAEFQHSIVLLTKDGPVVGAGICGDVTRRIWHQAYKFVYINNECNLNNTNVKIF